MVEGVLAVVAGDGEEAGGREALVQGVGEGVTDPIEIGLTGAIVEGQDEDDSTCGRRVRGLREGGKDAKEKREKEPMTKGTEAKWSEPAHRLSIEL